jgi:OmpA-OmpF porin, OOP family
MKTLNMFAAAAAIAIAAPAFAQDSEAKIDYDCALYNECSADEGVEDAGQTRGGFTMRKAVETQPRIVESARGGFTMRRTPVVMPQAGTRARLVPKPAQIARPKAVAVPGSRQQAAMVRNAQMIGFVSGSAQLQPGAMTVVSRLAASMNRADKAGERFRIEGHTDAVGSRATNLELSTRRAQAVADQLIALGIDADRLEVVGYGFDQPLADIAPTASANRRVVAKVIN